MSKPKSLMLHEAGQAPQVVAEMLAREAPAFAALARAVSARGLRLFSTAARGSSDHAATVFKYLMEIETGLPVVSIGPSVASVYHRPLHLEGAVHVTISQSGASPDIVALQAAAKAGGALTVAVVNVTESPVAAAADIVIGLGAGEERSIAATKSFIASVAALAGVVTAVGGSTALARGLARLPDALAATEGLEFGDAVKVLTGASSLFVAGRGPGYGIALEAALKAKETAALHAEAFSLAELQHGPMRLVGPGFPVLAFVPDDAGFDGNQQTLARLRGMGARTFALSSRPIAGADVLPSCGSGLLDPLVALLHYYRLIEAVARARGHDPDRPANLAKVTETL
ncbi:MAG: SIS domain-containing protein [Phaeovulum sp.]|uniref:SIS domain-containing protein n=1 Tax=Phaeovulum sp. TaxID=2934796 RepID=UPI00272F8FC2|nr:SIS domain-containing protein [Phaeovulum sp.]MDP2062917.1 SIS domain-containing protein [Phaeovulum sp.]